MSFIIVLWLIVFLFTSHLSVRHGTYSRFYSASSCFRLYRKLSNRFFATTILSQTFQYGIHKQKTRSIYIAIAKYNRFCSSSWNAHRIYASVRQKKANKPISDANKIRNNNNNVLNRSSWVPFFSSFGSIWMWCITSMHSWNERCARL